MPSKQRQSEGGPVYVNRFREQDSATVSWVSNIASYYDRPEEEPPVLSKFWRQLKVQSEAEGELPICFVIEPEDANLETVRETLCEVWDKSPSDLTLSLLASYRADTDNGKWVPTYHDTTIPQGESVDICPGDCFCVGQQGSCANSSVPSELAPWIVREIAATTMQSHTLPDPLEVEDLQDVVQSLVTNWRNGTQG